MLEVPGCLSICGRVDALLRRGFTKYFVIFTNFGIFTNSYMKFEVSRKIPKLVKITKYLVKPLRRRVILRRKNASNINFGFVLGTDRWVI